jgi:hypothetical protein
MVTSQYNQYDFDSTQHLVTDCLTFYNQSLRSKTCTNLKRLCHADAAMFQASQ